MSKPGKLKVAHPGLLWVIEVEWKRRRGKPVEAIAITTGGVLQALFLAKELAEKLKVPRSWVNPVFYRRRDAAQYRMPKLTAEVEELKADDVDARINYQHWRDAEAENTRRKAEIEQLKRRIDKLTAERDGLQRKVTQLVNAACEERAGLREAGQ